MRPLPRAVLWAALVGALFLGAPTSTYAAQTITNVPASVTWGSTNTGGGASAEIRARVTSTDTTKPIVIKDSGTNYIPTFGITNLCRTAVYATPTCVNDDADGITRGHMLMAASSASCSLNATCFSSCVAGVNPNLTSAPSFLASSPQTAGTGKSGRAPGYALCATGSGTGASTGCLDCYAVANGAVTIANLYVAVTVPAGKNSGTYAATLTFAIQ
jgi:hypothetical protein